MKTYISSDNKLNIGKIYGNNLGDEVSNNKAEYKQNIPFLVIKEATLEEFTKFCIENGCDLEEYPIDTNKNFYEILMD